MDNAVCGANNRAGNPCQNRAGKGTSHVGFGYCASHGGKTPSGQMHGAKLAALAAMAPLGGEVDVNPLDALLYAVRRASGMAAWFRLEAEAEAMVGKANGALDNERLALADLAKWAKMAIDAGVAERQVRIAERMGERLSAAFEAAIGALVAAGVELTGDQRMLAVRTYAGELARHEGGGDIQASAKDA